MDFYEQNKYKLEEYWQDEESNTAIADYDGFGMSNEEYTAYIQEQKENEEYVKAFGFDTDEYFEDQDCCNKHYKRLLSKRGA